MTASTIRLVGVLTALGGILWGLSWIFFPSKGELGNSQLEIWGGALFQVGLGALLSLMWVTCATGTGRLARGVLACEIVALILAVGWTIPYMLDANRPMTGILIVLDVFWPLSMVGFFAVSALVARARRWPTPLRFLPLVASLLLPVDLAFSWAPDNVRSLITGGYLMVGFGLVGLGVMRQAQALTATRPALLAGRPL